MLNSIHAKGLIFAALACVLFIVYNAREAESFNVSEGSTVKLSDRAFPCKTEKDLSAALDHFMRGENGAQQEMISSGKCFSAAKSDSITSWKTVSYSGRFWSIQNSESTERYWVLAEWLKVN
jgi:hypothetical protein